MENIQVNATVVLAALAILATMLVALLAISAKAKKITDQLLELPPEERAKIGEKIREKAREKARRFEEGRILVFLFGLVIMVTLVAIYAGAGAHAWGFALALLPFIMIVQHAMFLRNVRQPVLVPRENAPDGSSKSGISSEENWWPSVLRSAKRTTERYFSASSLAIRYGASAIAILMVSLVAFLFIFVPEITFIPESPKQVRILHEYNLVHPAILGTAGAYVYVLLHLGYRNLTHDVTSGGAMWCSISLAIGPILACAISYFLVAPTQDPGLGADAIYFIAGLSPRYVTSRVEALVRKAWGAPSEVAPPPRTIPTTQVKGISAEIAERLAEEGIADVHGLAMADPLRLIRNTNFDRRQIVAWIDEAILITTVPGRWEALEEEGIPGAVALVSLVYDPPYEKPKAAPPEGSAKNDSKASGDDESLKGIKREHLQMLAHCLVSKRKDDTSKHETEDADEIKMLRGIATQLKDDAQLRLIWVLHNHLGDEAEAEGPAPAGVPATT